MTKPSTLKQSRVFQNLLDWSGSAWFIIAAIGQLGFIVFIIGFYGTRIFFGNIAAWSDKNLIDGYIEGDLAGNLMFAIHVLTAAVMILSGLIQLTPQIRKRAPHLHRISGRIYLVTACFLAVGGLWMTWIRGTHLNIIGAYAITLDAILILVCAYNTVKNAILRDIKTHQRWAMRLFMAANGVWFMRVSIMAWMIIAGGPVGMNQDMSGPANHAMAFGCYLIPLGLYELYRISRQIPSIGFKIATTILMCIAIMFTGLGVFGTINSMWMPYL
ncbi:DUF2306 domain-containing protein [Hirschia litorea]|uniref:DUF2306 domain-containing protein n=1 Tax=Hirschia litorea TaxID=1199156 RepID=A0ABW2IJR8_9PROT